ncbi:hypothetical protein P7K49_008751, partial [Saguinus oedipus]
MHDHSNVQTWALRQGLGWPCPPPPSTLVLFAKGAAGLGNPCFCPSIDNMVSCGRKVEGPLPQSRRYHHVNLANVGTVARGPLRWHTAKNPCQGGRGSAESK